MPAAYLKPLYLRNSALSTVSPFAPPKMTVPTTIDNTYGLLYIAVVVSAA
jgi:hypothetical protein